MSNETLIKEAASCHGRVTGIEFTLLAELTKVTKVSPTIAPVYCLEGAVRLQCRKGELQQSPESP